MVSHTRSLSELSINVITVIYKVIYRYRRIIFSPAELTKDLDFAVCAFLGAHLAKN